MRRLRLATQPSGRPWPNGWPRATPAARTKADARVNVEFVQPRMAMIGEMESGLRQMLAGGARDGLVVDPYQELGATGWAAADGVKARLMALQALRERLLKLEPKPGG